MLAFSCAHGSINSNSPGKISFTFVDQLKSPRFAGSEVTFLPFEKSSIKMPMEADRKALEQDAMKKMVCNNIWFSEWVMRNTRERGAYVAGHSISIFCPISPCCNLRKVIFK
jgi:hypothetical protein